MDVLSKSNWRRAGDSGMRAHAAPLRRLRALRAALDNAYALPQLRTLSGSNPRRPLKTEKGRPGGRPFQVKLAESWGFEPQMPFWGILA